MWRAFSRVAGIQPQTLLWTPRTRLGRAAKKRHRDGANGISAKEVALRLPAKAWRTIRWREGTNEWLSSRFARVRVSVASSHQAGEKPAKEWLLIEWPEGEDAPTKYWLSTLPKNISFHDLVDAAKLRWRGTPRCSYPSRYGHRRGNAPDRPSGSSHSGLSPSRSKVRCWMYVGVARRAGVGVLAHRTVLRVSVARSASIVRKLWTGRPFGALGLGLALGGR
jgi:hypothetical protein